MSETAIINDPEVVQDFVVEAEEILDNAEFGLVALEKDPTDSEQLNNVFRGIHTIKGVSSFLGFPQVEQLAHVAEDVLQLLRSKKLAVEREIISVLLEAQDILRELLDRVKDGDSESFDLSDIVRKLKLIEEGKFKESAPEKELVKKRADRVQPETETMQQPSAEIKSASEVPKPKEESASSSIKSTVTETKKDAREKKESNSIRVETQRLDDLMDLVGELVIERNRLLDLSKDMNQHVDGALEFKERVMNVVERTDFITGALQMAGLRMRMMPMERIFKKLPRLVRDVAGELNKQVELVLSGGDTEVDKTVVDHLSDPLVHLIRNSLDHGIESPDEREQLGKPRKGAVHVSASHEGHHIVVRVRDDGKGINTEQVVKKVVEKNLLGKEQIEGMNRQEILNLIFLPGLSTAKKVDNVSGRGVGMDVVKTNIKKLNGLININTKLGEDTEVVLRLPLTLATMQTLLVKVGEEVLALPLFSVLEAKRLAKNEIKSVNQRQVINHRNSAIPLIHLERLLPWLQDRKNGKEGYVILLGAAEGRVGLVVDHLLHQEEVVVKSLGDYLGAIPGIAGGTIAGDGRVRLIVDTAQLIEMEQNRKTRVGGK